MEKKVRIIIEKHADGFIAYPIGMKGVVVGEGDTFQAALADVTSAIKFHIETFGKEVLADEELVEDAFIAETGVMI